MAQYDATRAKPDAHFMPPAAGNGGTFGLSPIEFLDILFARRSIQSGGGGAY